MESLFILQEIMGDTVSFKPLLYSVLRLLTEKKKGQEPFMMIVYV